MFSIFIRINYRQRVIIVPPYIVNPVKYNDYFFLLLVHTHWYKLEVVFSCGYFEIFHRPHKSKLHKMTLL